MNKQQQLMVIGAVAAVLLLGGGAWFFLSQQKPADGGSPPVTPQVAGAPAGMKAGGSMGAAAGEPGSMGQPGSMGMPSPAHNVRPGGAAPTAGANMPPGRTVARVVLPGGRRRQDPFVIDWKLPVPPPYVFDEVDPIRLASDVVETPPSEPYEVREQPQMRVSGIMNGDGVYAIIERPEAVDVVKPGSTIDINVGGQTKRTYKVVSITKDRVKLRSQVGNVIYTQDVPLSDVAVGVAPRAGGSFGGSPSAPGAGSFGSGGLPGSPGGRPPGSFGSGAPGSFGGRRGGANTPSAN